MKLLYHRIVSYKKTLNQTMINITNLSFTWPGQKNPTLDIQSLSIAKGERVFLQGPSGSGKSTLLGLLAGINTIKQGEITLLDTPMSSLSATSRDAFRADHIGTIFQNFNLLPYLSPLENVVLGCEFSKKRTQAIKTHSRTVKEHALLLLNELGIAGDLLNRSVNELSIGQQQRVAAARAFLGEPEIIIADEPTSALDSDSRHAFITMLFKQANRYGATVIFVSHDSSLAPLFTRTVHLNEINRAAL